MIDAKKINLVAERNKTIRRRLEVSQKDWGLLFGKSESTVILNEKGTSKIDSEDFLNIQSLFGNQCILFIFGIEDHPFESLEDWAAKQKKVNEKIKELKAKQQPKKFPHETTNE